jgi:hypothetical protein
MLVRQCLAKQLCGQRHPDFIYMNNMQLQWSYRKIKAFIFYGNYFYGLCAVALSIEAALQQHIPLNRLIYYFLVFVSTVLYYDYPYARKYTAASNNPRTNWYIQHYNFVRCNQIVITVILSAALILFFYYHSHAVLSMEPLHWLLVFIFPFVAALYYGINFLSHRYNIRKVGWLAETIYHWLYMGWPGNSLSGIILQHYSPAALPNKPCRFFALPQKFYVCISALYYV